MPDTSRIRTLLLAVPLTLATASAQDELPDVDATLRQRFGFLDPIVKKLGYGTNLLQAVRWQKGGPTHVLVNNPHRARLDDLHVTKNQLESKPITTDGDLSGLATADVNGDDVQDILMLTSRGRLVIELRDKSARRIPDVEVGRGAIANCLRCGDIDGDGKSDALVLTKDGLRCITRLAAGAKVGDTVPVFAKQIQSFHLIDFNADDHLDVVICSRAARMQLHVKLGDGRGGFGPWILLSSPRLLSAFPGTNSGGIPTIAAIHFRPRRVVEYRLNTTEDARRPALLLTALRKTTKTRAFVHGDVDNDGDLDLVVSDPERARLTFLLEDGDRFRVHSTPTLAGVQSLAIGDADGDGKNDLVLASNEEEIIAWVSGAARLDTFPKRVAALPQIDGKPAAPLALTVRDGEILAILRNKRKKAGLYRLRPGVSGAADGEDAAVVELLALGSLTRDPRRLVCADFDGVHGPDLAYVVPNGGLNLLFRTADGRYQRAPEPDGPGFTKRMEDGALSLTGSAKDRALLIVRERYARTIRFDKSGPAVIVAQDNGPEGDHSMAMGIVLADGTRVFVDRKANRLFRLVPDRPAVSIDLPPISPIRLLAHGREVLVLGRLGILRVPFTRSFELQAVRRHEPPTTKTRYFRGLAADLDGDGKLELAVMDSTIHGLHVLVADGDKLQRGLSFPVFQSPNADVQEPRAMATGDVNGDGRDDLLLLSHDRILVYHQER